MRATATIAVVLYYLAMLIGSRAFPILNARSAFFSGPLSLKSSKPYILSTHQQGLFTLFTSNDPNPEMKPPWEYKGYIPPPPTPGRRRFSTDVWNVPNNITIPEDRLELSFVRSSGAGGQNVNKLSTKVEIRFHLDDADWIPKEVRDRIREQQPSRVNKDGYFSLSSQEHRTQIGNRKDAMDKLKSLILLAWPRPKIRKIRTGVSKVTKERNKEDKRILSDKKANRKGVDFF